MAIDFSLTNEQRKLQADMREFAENVLGPVVREADAEPDPLRGFQRTKEAYVAAYQAGIAFCMLPREYGGGGVYQRRADHRCRRDLRGRPRLRLHGAGQRPGPDAGLVLGQRRAEGSVPARGDV